LHFPRNKGGRTNNRRIRKLGGSSRIIEKFPVEGKGGEERGGDQFLRVKKKGEHKKKRGFRG